MSSVKHFYRKPALSEQQVTKLISDANQLEGLGATITSITTEVCYNVQLTKALTEQESEKLIFLLSETFEAEQFSCDSFLCSHEAGEGSPSKKHKPNNQSCIVEVGPRLNFSTAWSSNAVEICKSCGLNVPRVERSRRYRITTEDATPLKPAGIDAFLTLVHDRMTETRYEEPLSSFDCGLKPAAVYNVPVMKEGRSALERINKDLGLGFDEQDLAYYTDLFLHKIKRDPTSVEVFDLGQSNSEHSRHWFFTGTLEVDGEAKPHTLFQLVKEPWKRNKNNSTIGFHDNSSAQKGFVMTSLVPDKPGYSGPMGLKELDYDITLTAETHNFPTGVCPFAGAETGPGGRLRDGHSTGTGSLVVAGTAGYCVGNLNLEENKLPWEDSTAQYPPQLAPPDKIIIDASNGASDYGNKFGEPMIQGFTRSFGEKEGNGDRREWIKPIMFSAGVGQLDARHRVKGKPEAGMKIIKIGGPAYRIGMGGGAASSMVQGDNDASLDFNAVQRGDAEMEQKYYRVVRACCEMGDSNPIVSIHDQGAGGNGNVLKEIAEPLGAKIDIRAVLSGDDTLSVLELWGAEYQENSALLIREEKLALFDELCVRENAPYSVVGTVSDDGRVVVVDKVDNSTPYDMTLDDVLGKLPAKTFKFDTISPVLKPLSFPNDLTIGNALDRVLRLLSVGSKRFLTNKVDRSVTGLIAQQQCVGPLHIPLADVAVIAQSHFSKTGAALSIGEQPIKGLINPAAMARMSIAESLTNLVWAKVTSRSDIKCSGNWMWAAKMAGEGPLMYEAATALRDMMISLEIALDGGKDSLSMAARVVDEEAKTTETVKCPGALVISAYVTCPDITLTVTPDLKSAGSSALLFVSLSEHQRLGGSALGQVFNQIGDQSPDVHDVPLLGRAFDVIQNLIGQKQILAGHDRSDGGLLTTVLEMAFAGNCGVSLSLKAGEGSPLSLLFNEEVGMLMEVSHEEEKQVVAAFAKANVPCEVIGQTTQAKRVVVQVDGNLVLDEDMTQLRDVWEQTSFVLEKRQCNPACVEQEQKQLASRTGPTYVVPFTPAPTKPLSSAVSIAVVRQEGSNGDREMCSAFHSAGFTVMDVHMRDIEAGRVNLDAVRGMAFVGGFSFADVMDSAKGWAGCIRFNTVLQKAFEHFYQRTDTFSLGVCNGCQLMALMGWVPGASQLPAKQQPRFVHNESGRFEARWSSVQIGSSPAIMLQGMEGTTVGVWVAHGEGRAHFPDSSILDNVLTNHLAPIRYVDDSNKHTQSYPHNPNGSPHAIAGLCSPNGRHLAMMPHPERCFKKWQWPYMPKEVAALEVSPWLRMFQNARTWCDSTAQN